tara:strand:- start:3820 stop:6093 length:2274 start_codon:yes stop_codon:yes gene_type:complete
MSIKQTFWGLLDHYQVEIPIIQRDYAQGRKDAKALQIREGFVRSLFDMVTNTDATQDLDFIYGSVKHDKLVLLDGQQRLTTLFLLHWYISTAAGEISTANTKLAKFRYETRVSSREFVESLLKFSDDFSLSDAKPGELSGLISDAHWFFSEWRNDPTVQSMLTMLDEIHRIFQPALSEAKGLWSKLTCSERPPITFHFLNMQDFSLTDELYIKMNARGQALTEFESFKAWLQGYSEKTDGVEVGGDFWQAMDKKWTDFFWRRKDKGVYEIDELFLRYFKSVALANLARSLSLSGPKLSKGEDALVSGLRDNSYIPVQVYVERDCFVGESLNQLSLFLNLVHQLQESEQGSMGGNFWQQYKWVVDGVIKENSSLRGQARFYALYLYVAQVGQDGLWGDEALAGLLDWMGVTIRLINNTPFGNSSDYVRSVQALDGMRDLIGGDLLERLAETEAKDIKFFTGLQWAEEVLKSKLVVADPSWKPLLRKCEEHSYFYGQIGFLLESCRDSDGVHYSQNKFVTNANKASVLFSEALIETPDFLLQRALLAIGDYLISVGSNFSFCKSVKGNARDRNENWRKVFNDPSRSKVLFDLLEMLDEGSEKEGLLRVVEGADTRDWRQFFIRYPETIAYCGKRQARFYDEVNDEIYLLNSIRMTGRQRGLRTYALYKEIERSENPDISELQPRLVPYFEFRVDRTCSGVIIEPWQHGALQIEFIDSKYELRLFDGDEEQKLLESKAISAVRVIISKLEALENKVESDE